MMAQSPQERLSVLRDKIDQQRNTIEALKPTVTNASTPNAIKADAGATDIEHRQFAASLKWP
jgi:cell division protein FtsL